MQESRNRPTELLPLMTRRGARWGVALAIVLTASSSFAAKSKGDEAFEKGRAALASGDYAGACAFFEESVKLDPAPGTVLNLGICNEKQGKFIAAVGHYKNAALAFGKAPARADAEKRAEEAERKVALVIVRRSPNLPADARISINGKQLAPEELEKPMRIDPGSVELAVDADGFERNVTPVRAESGMQSEAIAVQGARLSTKTVVKTEVRDGVPPLRTVGFVVGGVGVASLVVGSITGILAMGQAGIYRDACDRSTTPNVCDQRGYDSAQSLKTLAPLSTITLIAGGVLVAGGVTLILVAPKSSTSDRPRAGHLQFTPSFGPQTAGGSLSYTFQ